MFERFTEHARQVVVLAQDEARALKHHQIGTEHVLLGLLRGEGLAACVLESLGVPIEAARAQVARRVPQSDRVVTGQMPFTPRAKRVLELALRESLSLGHNYIGTEHILLAIVRENKGVSARILFDFDADPEKVRTETFRLLVQQGYEPPPPSAPESLQVVELPDAPSFERRSEHRLLLTGSLLFAVPLGVGVLIGWAIWGRREA